jgi:hypothetical protein
MGATRGWRRLWSIAVAALLATACATTMTSSGQKAAEKKEGAVIRMGVGHFDRDGKPFHYWDKEKEIPPVCARCHAADGLATFIRDGKNGPAPHVKNAFACTNCHADMLTYARHPVSKVTFASGLTVASASADSNLCMTCHQGRESTASVNKAIAGTAPDEVNPKIPPVHVHYLPAGATLYGTEAKVAYEYAGKTYAGRNTHGGDGPSTCVACHGFHRDEFAVDECSQCHKNVNTLADLAGIRTELKGDFDGNGREEGIGREVENQKKALYAAIQQYAKNVAGTPIAFSPDGFPYWFADTNGNGRIDPDEFKPANGYKAYTPRLMQAVYNYTYTVRDPGAAYHNARYTLQLLYDSLDSLAASGKAGVAMQGRVRP